ncbi:MAG TPA: N-acetyltransferase [Candidatus Competibacteraceae bacterium]|nr:N-acetyltransferase [Candidatus Competibacteraceae bacterium]
MRKVEFVSFNHIDPEELMIVINEDSLRTHLIDHAYFDVITIREWMEGKVKTDSLPGCRIRAVFIGGQLAGWCGIQPDENGFELAIVISKKFWGYGISIFKTLMGWANEFGHKDILFHLLESRPQYKALKKIASNVYKTKLAGRNFTTYHISVDK